MRFAPIILVATTACVGDVAEDPNLGEVESLSINCPKWGCNENSPVMGPYKFHELYLPGGQTNLEDVSVDGFWKNGIKYTPFMSGGYEFRASHPVYGTLYGHGLENGFLKLVTPQGAFQLRFKHVTPASENSVKFWVGTQSPVQTYELEYTGPGYAIAQRLCFNPPNGSQSSGDGGNQVWWAPLEAVLYGNERVDSGAKTVYSHGVNSTTAGWLTIGCAGSSLAKLHLTRHTHVGGNSDASRMQAMLKMYVSDVCGDGTSFTDQGTPLHWKTSTNVTNGLTGNEYAYEALWSAEGALCLDVHRLGWKYTSEIEAKCGNKLQACPTINPNALPTNAYIVTAVPENPYPFIPIFF